MSTVADDRHSNASKDAEQLRDDVPTAGNTLLLTPAMGELDDYGCAQLSDVAPPAEMSVIWVAFARSLDNRLRVWRTHVDDDPPARLGFVDVGRSHRSQTTINSREGIKGDVSLETVSPTDLTGLGITVNEYAAEWGNGSGHLAVCFHSLSVLLQYVGLRHAFRFLHNTMGVLRSADATAHFHMDPTVHDERTVNSVRMLFDAIVAHEGNTWNVATR